MKVVGQMEDMRGQASDRGSLNYVYQGVLKHDHRVSVRIDIKTTYTFETDDAKVCQQEYLF